MSEIDLKAVDLNLLVTLDALLTERSVSRAARRLGVGQPAASHRLAQLRELLDDPLLVRSGRRMVPTPRGEALAAPLARLLADARRLLQQRPAFDPATTEAGFTVLSPDVLAPVLPGILARIRTEAPNASLTVVPRGTRDPQLALDDGLVDLALVPSLQEGPGLMARGLGALHLGVVARVGHPAVCDGALSAEDWVAWPHVMVRTGAPGRSMVERAIEAAGYTRRVGLVTPTFLAALFAVADTDLLFAAPRALVRRTAARLGLVVLPAPLPLPAVPVAAAWHERFQQDAQHRFFRERIIAALEEVLGRG
ncbi:MAG: LysR family transcriptional regulator [Alphaproteobacteria bacterium]|nr:LysR family transcriptional regulator [Alphaproteobacteria bacterium]